MRTTHKNQKGFTLIEMLIYTAFLAVFVVITVRAVVVTMKSLYALRITQSIVASGTTSMERMAREVRNAYDISYIDSTLGTNPGRLTLNTKDAGGSNTTVEFYVSNNELRIKEGGVDKGPLMTKHATLTNLTFAQATSTRSKAVKIEMSISDDRDPLARVVTFRDTMLLRGSLR